MLVVVSERNKVNIISGILVNLFQISYLSVYNYSILISL